MSEQDGMSCGEFADVAAELALGVLTGRERAQAVAHLDQCDSCREHVRQLSLTGEEMLGLLPSREPPEGFESRVMARLGVTEPAPAMAPSPGGNDSKSEKTPARWSRRMLAMAAVALAVVACGLGGWALRGVTGSSSGGGGSAAQAPLREATLTSATHQNEGKVYLYDGNPRWLYMGVDSHDTSDKTVICQLETRSGRFITIGSFDLQGGYGAWGSPDPVAASDVTRARITSMDGTVLATANFTSH
ncbi:MAG TPA: hypothetical protein VHZ03_42975 [Trebonia sp.]|nr:hypothetical protein [Trebonia sp.]